jgi:quercetin dioxygenase-like cupin family protein
MAEEAAKVAPHVYKAVFENDRMRLLEVRMAPGVRTELHAHPDYLVHALSDGLVRLTDASGEGADVEIHAGDSLWRDAEEHSAVNIGDSELVAVFVELK